MKRTLLIVLATLGVSLASAQNVNINVDFDLYPEYYSHYDDDIYRYGFNINNYAVQYEERFVIQIYQEYGIRKSVVRRYLRRGFSPSDILFGAELSYRTGHRFEYILDGYYNSPSRDWISISVNLGIPFGTPRFNLILNSFNRYYVDWGRYYHNHHPHGRPPMYSHSWSYFRPSPTPNRRPSPVTRPPQVNRPGQSAQPGRPQEPNRPSGNSDTNYRRGSSSSNSGQQARPTTGATGSSNNSETTYQRGSSTSTTSSSDNRQETRPAQPARTNDNSGTQRKEENATSSSSNRETSTSSSRSSSSSSSSNNSGSTVRRSGSNSNSSSGSSRSSSGSPSRSSSSSSGSSSSGRR